MHLSNQSLQLTFYINRILYDVFTFTGHDRHEPRPERESDRNERNERNERVSHKRTSSATHSNTYWRNNRPEYEEPRNRTSSTVVHEGDTNYD